MICSRTAPIALFDSGAGGIGVLREVQKLLPWEQLLYFGDAANAPYGERAPHEVRALVIKHSARLLTVAKALVLACNTATALAAQELRLRYPHIPIICMEPALRPALRVREHPTVAVLATTVTLQGEKFAQLRQKYEKSATVLPICAPGIVRLVEQGLANSPQMDAYLQSLFSTLPQSPDAVVLGCTHFPFAQNAIRRTLGQNIPLFDGAAGTARELYRRLAAQDLLAPTTQAGAVQVFSSAPASLPLFIRLYKGG